MNKITLSNARLVMGIVNITPDSFFKKSCCFDENLLIKRLEQLKSEQVDIIDVGACSTRPNGNFVSESEEFERLLPVLKIIKNYFPQTPISIDTFRSKVVMECAKTIDFDIINDVSGGMFDKQMFDVVAELKKTYILTHIQGSPQTMSSISNTTYRNLLQEIVDFFDSRLQQLADRGVFNIIIDPGFGFAKTIEQNYTLLKNLHLLKKWGLPLLVGISRKSMIYKVLGITPEEALNGTIVMNTLALAQGANILRVHDVYEAHQVIKLFDNYNNA